MAVGDEVKAGELVVPVEEECGGHGEKGGVWVEVGVGSGGE